MMRNRTLMAGMAAVASFSMANPAIAAPVSRTISIDVTLQTELVLESLDCQNSSGHYISVGGRQSGLPGVNGKVTFKSPSNKNAVSADNEMLLTAGPTTYLDKRGVGGGVGGNPWIYVAGDGGAPVLLGRCVQGFKANWSLNRTVTLPVNAVSQATSCSVTGSAVDTNATMLDPVSTPLTITFDNKAPDNPSSPRPHKGSANVSFSLTSTSGYAAPGKHKGIGGNPDVYLNIATGAPLGDGVYLGRCRSLL